MKKNFNKKHDIKVDITKCHNYLKECVCFENIEDKEFICKKLNLIKEYRNVLPAEIYSRLDMFIKTTIYPIVYDVDYFSFLKREEYGSCNEKGHFIINSDSSLEMMIFLLYEHTLELDEKVDKFVYENLCLEGIRQK